MPSRCFRQGATDAARAAADIVLTEPGLSTIVHGIIIARTIFQRIQNFITYRVAATLQVSQHPDVDLLTPAFPALLSVRRSAGRFEARREGTSQL